MRTSWTVSGLILVVLGAAGLAAALGVLGFSAAPLNMVLGQIGGTALAIGADVLFFEWKDHRR